MRGGSQKKQLEAISYECRAEQYIDAFCVLQDADLEAAVELLGGRCLALPAGASAAAAAAKRAEGAVLVRSRAGPLKLFIWSWERWLQRQTAMSRSG